MNLSKLLIEFIQIAKYLVYKKISQGETCLLTQFLSSDIHGDKSSHEFVQMVKYFAECRMDSSKLTNVFVQHAEQQHHFFFLPFTETKRQKYCLLFCHINSKLNSHLQIRQNILCCCIPRIQYFPCATFVRFLSTVCFQMSP